MSAVLKRMRQTLVQQRTQCERSDVSSEASSSDSASDSRKSRARTLYVKASPDDKSTATSDTDSSIRAGCEPGARTPGTTPLVTDQKRALPQSTNRPAARVRPDSPSVLRLAAHNALSATLAASSRPTVPQHSLQPALGAMRDAAAAHERSTRSECAWHDANMPNFLDGPESIQLDDDICEVRALLEERSALRLSRDPNGCECDALSLDDLSPSPQHLCSRSPERCRSGVVHHAHTHVHYGSPSRSPERRACGAAAARLRTCSPGEQSAGAAGKVKGVRRASSQPRGRPGAGITAFRPAGVRQVAGNATAAHKDTRRSSAGRVTFEAGPSHLRLRGDLRRANELLQSAELRVQGQNETIRNLQSALGVKEAALALLQHELQAESARNCVPASPLRRAAAAADTHAAAATAARADLAAARKAERQLRGQLSALGETLDATKQGERHAKQRCSSMMDALRRVQSEKRACVGEQEALARRVAVQQRTVAALQGKVASLEAALVKEAAGKQAAERDLSRARRDLSEARAEAAAAEQGGQERHAALRRARHDARQQAGRLEAAEAEAAAAEERARHLGRDAHEAQSRCAAAEQEAATLREALVRTQQGAEAMMQVIQSIRNTEALSDASAGHLQRLLHHDQEVARGALQASCAVRAQREPSAAGSEAERADSAAAEMRRLIGGNPPQFFAAPTGTPRRQEATSPRFVYPATPRGTAFQVQMQPHPAAESSAADTSGAAWSPAQPSSPPKGTVTAYRGQPLEASHHRSPCTPRHAGAHAYDSPTPNTDTMRRLVGASRSASPSARVSLAAPERPRSHSASPDHVRTAARASMTRSRSASVGGGFLGRGRMSAAGGGDDDDDALSLDAEIQEILRRDV